jgi:hypothetical protein
VFGLITALALSSFAWAPRIPICVAVAPSVPSRILKPALNEADAIWRSAGVAIEWHVTTCDRDSPSRLSVQIGDEPAPSSSSKSRRVLGWIIFTAPGVPMPRIIVSQAAVAQLMNGQDQYRDEPITLRDIRLSRAIGRALAHEIGHYLLRSSVHPPAGLMRATHSSNDLFALNRSGFDLTPEEGRIAAHEVDRLVGYVGGAARR